MIVIKIWGGIGNQMFQFCFGEFLANFSQVKVLYDIGNYNLIDKKRNFELGIFDKKLTLFESPKLFFSKSTGIEKRILRLFYKLNSNHYYFNDSLYEKLLPEKFIEENLYYFEGYWQSEKYINALKNSAINILKVSTDRPKILSSIYKSINDCSHSTSIHIRRGDYYTGKNKNIYGICDRDYYEKSINYCLSRNPSTHFYIFSDDLNWVRNNINIPKKSTFISNYEVNSFWYIDLMSLCNNNIISNSSFSWWGAYLNNNKSNIVVSPKRWTLKSQNTIALNHWIKI